MDWPIENCSGMNGFMLSSNSWSRPRFAGWWVAAWIGLFSANSSWGAEAASPGPRVLTTAAQVQALRPEQAGQKLRVLLRGIITYSDAPWDLCFVQDGTAGIYLYRKDEAGRLEPGQEVEVGGYTINAAGNPAVLTTTVKVLGRAPLPPAQAHSFEQLAGGGYEGQWVEIEDFVRSVSILDHHCQVHLGRRGSFSAFIPVGPETPLPTDWIESTVRLRGVYRAKVDAQNQKIGFSIFTPGLDQVQIVARSDVDAWTRPALSLAELRMSTNGLALDRRSKVRGVVTHQQADGNFFVQDGSGGACVQAFPKVRLTPGERVEVAGFPALVKGVPTLMESEVRRLGHGVVPAPLALRASEVLKGGHEGELLKVRGRLRQRVAVQDRLTLRLREGDVVVRASLESTNAAQVLPDLLEDSLLTVTGVWASHRSEAEEPRLLQLLLLSPSSVEVVHGPPWWTVPRALALFGSVTVMFLGWLGFSARREAALKEKYRQLFENSSDMIYTQTLDGTFTSLNPAWERITGWPRAGTVALSLDQLVVPEQRQRLQAAITKIAENGGSGFLEFDILTREGKQRSLEASARVLRRKGRAAAIEGIARDVTDRKRSEAELRTSREQLRLLAARLQSIREEERARIARDVHDELGQSLTALKMDIAGIASRLPSGDTALLERARTMSGSIDASIQTVRKIATDLRPGILDNLGLVAALEWQAEEFQKRTGIACDFAAKLDDAWLNSELCTALFRIFQETLTNVARHAQATKVLVTLSESEGQAVLAVQDDGQGIQEQQSNWRQSLGLLGIQERVFGFGGEVMIAGAPGQGTSVTVRVPLSGAGTQRT